MKFWQQFLKELKTMGIQGIYKGFFSLGMSIVLWFGPYSPSPPERVLTDFFNQASALVSGLALSLVSFCSTTVKVEGADVHYLRGDQDYILSYQVDYYVVQALLLGMLFTLIYWFLFSRRRWRLGRLADSIGCGWVVFCLLYFFRAMVYGILAYALKSASFLVWLEPLVRSVILMITLLLFAAALVDNEDKKQGEGGR